MQDQKLFNYIYLLKKNHQAILVKRVFNYEANHVISNDKIETKVINAKPIFLNPKTSYFYINDKLTETPSETDESELLLFSKKIELHFQMISILNSMRQGIDKKLNDDLASQLSQTADIKTKIKNLIDSEKNIILLKCDAFEVSLKSKIFEAKCIEDIQVIQLDLVNNCNLGAYAPSHKKAFA